MICQNCGAEFNGNFCPTCGAKADEADARQNNVLITEETDAVYENNTVNDESGLSLKKAAEYAIGLLAFALLCGWLLGKIGRQSLVIWIVVAGLCIFPLEALKSRNSPSAVKWKGILVSIPVLIEAVIVIVVCSALGYTLLGIIVAVLSLTEIPFVKKKLKGKVSYAIEIVSVGVAILAIILIFVSYRHISNVKGGTPTGYPGITYGQAFESYFRSPKWNHFKSDTGVDIIEFTGYFQYQGDEVEALIQFVEYPNRTFKPTYFSIDDVPQNEYVMGLCIMDVFEEY